MVPPAKVPFQITLKIRWFPAKVPYQITFDFTFKITLNIRFEIHL